MRCKKNQVVMQADITVHTKDHRGHKIKRSNAERHVEAVLAKVFRAFVSSYGKMLVVSYDGDIEVLPEGC